MRIVAILLLMVVLPKALLAQREPAPVPAREPAGTMSELMVRVIYPASDAIFYIETRTPTDSEEWGELEGMALMLAESGNLLMTPERAWDDDQWMRDARLMRDAGEAAFRAAIERDVEALVGLNEQLYRSCVTCHEHYRPGYPTRP